MSPKAKAAKRRRPTADERLDESLKGSFPASDPPSQSGTVAGGPRRDNRDDKDKSAGGKRPPKR